MLLLCQVLTWVTKYGKLHILKLKVEFMPSKITDAINQLLHSINSLSDAVPAVYDTIKTKEVQIAELQAEYLKAHPDAITGYWDIDLSSDNDYEHVRLTGWKYDDEYWESTGDDNGNALVDAIGKSNEMPPTVELQTNYDQAECYAYPPSATVCFHAGNIALDFYFFTQADFFHFIKQHNIVIETTGIDEKIDGFKTRMDELIEVRKSINSAMGKETKPDNNLCCHPPLYVEEDAKPSVQFNAVQISSLHKHTGIVYEYLTNIIKQLHDNPEDVKLVEAMTHALFNVQGELDNIAVEIGDLDRSDEPSDIGMAGCTYWNMLHAAMSELDSTLDYIIQQDLPLFGEVRHRLGKLDTMLYNCCREFEDNWMHKNEKD